MTMAPPPPNNVAPRPASAAHPNAAVAAQTGVTPEQFGWEIPVATINPRIVAAVTALEKQGKTHFALTAARHPELCPVFIFDYDNGLEGVMEPFIAEVGPGKIFKVSFRMDPNWSTMPDAEKKIRATALYTDFQKYWAYAIASGRGTIIIDTHTEEYEIRRLSYFGKLQQVMPQHYGEVNNGFRADIREAYDSGMNIIMLQKLKKEYVSNNWTGKYEPAGFADLPFLVQANLQAYRDPADMQFKVLIKDCRQNAALANTLLVGDQCDMGFFLNLVFEPLGVRAIPSAKTRADYAAPTPAVEPVPPASDSDLPPHLRGLA